MLYFVQQDKKYIWTIISTLIVIGIAINLFVWQNGLLGLFFLIIYFVINGIWLGQILKRILFVKERAQSFFLKYKNAEIFSFLFGIFLLFYLISFLGAIFLNFWKFSIAYIPLILEILTLIISFLIHSNFFAKHLIKDIINPNDFFIEKTENFFNADFLKIISLFLLFLAGLLLLWNVRTVENIQSPWDVISKIYLYVYLVATFIVVSLIFSKQKIGFILFIIILHSFFLHSYLPIIYKAGFGENKWKHIGIERQLINNEEGFAPLIKDEEGSVNQWAVTIFLSKILNVDIFWIDLLLLYLMWSIFIPLIFFRLAEFLFQSFVGPPDNDCEKNQFLLLTAFLPSLFFSFQVYGSITTPMAFGYLFFFFVLLFWLDYLITKQKISLITAIIFSLLMFFGYQINFILILIVGIGVLIQNLKIKKIISLSNILVYCLLAVVFIFLILMLFNFNSSFGLINQDSFYQIKNNIQNVALFFSKHLSIIINFCIFSFIVLGIFKIKRISHSEAGKFLIGGFLIFWIVFLFSFYFTGNFNRNIELIVIFFTIFLLSWGIHCFLNLESKWLIKKQKIIAVCFFLAFSSTVVYASGPKLENIVTPNDLKLAENIWQEIQNNPKKLGHPCVLADASFLLAMEAISGRNIIDGGFSNETKKNQLFGDVVKNPSIRYMETATEMTQSTSCYLIVRDWQFENSETKKKIEDILESYEMVEQIYIFHYLIQ
ncbi:MAG: hypothetical protein AAB526_00860 [Patescibacteria group bacterium]